MKVSVDDPWKDAHGRLVVLHVDDLAPVTEDVRADHQATVAEGKKWCFVVSFY